MKKILVLIVAMLICVSAFSQSYKQAIGVKFGNTFSIEYKLNTSAQNFVHLGLTLPWNASGLYLSGFYNWNYDIDPIPGLSWYVGPGAYIGASFFPSSTQFYLSINAMLGVEYKFETIPLALSFDITPGVGISPNLPHFSWNVGLGVKYTL